MLSKIVKQTYYILNRLAHRVAKLEPKSPAHKQSTYNRLHDLVLFEIVVFLLEKRFHAEIVGCGTFSSLPGTFKSFTPAVWVQNILPSGRNQATGNVDKI